MTIIEVAQELEKDDRKRFRRDEDYETDAYCITLDRQGRIRDGEGTRFEFHVLDLLATDWEEVK